MANAAYHTNLFAPLFHICIGCDDEPNQLRDYHSDLGWDAITISRANEGDVFLWAYRNWGTHLVPVREDNWKDVVGMVKHATIAPTNWYVLRVQKTTTHGCVSGTMEHIGRADREELIEYVRRILVEQIKTEINARGAGH